MEYSTSKIKIKLSDFLDELIDISKVSPAITYEGDKFVIQFSADLVEGKEIMHKFLDKFMEAGLINSFEQGKAKMLESDNGITVSNGEKCDLNLKYDPNESNVDIIFKPKVSPDELYIYLEKARLFATRTNDKNPILSITNEGQILSYLKALHKINKSSEAGKSESPTSQYKAGFREAEARDNGEFIINYSADYAGRSSLMKFLELLNHANLIYRDDIDNVTPVSVENGHTISNHNIKLDIARKNTDIQVTLKPSRPEEFITALSNALDRVGSTLVSNSNIENIKTSKEETEKRELFKSNVAINTNLPPEIKQIARYLHKKTKEVFTNSSIKVHYYPPDKKDSEHAFIVNIAHQRYKDDESIQILDNNLNAVITKGGKVDILDTDKDSRKLSLILHCKPKQLLIDIRKNDGENLVKSNKSSLTR